MMSALVHPKYPHSKSILSIRGMCVPFIHAEIVVFPMPKSLDMSACVFPDSNKMLRRFLLITLL